MDVAVWDKIQSDKERRTLRMSVPGGWIYLILEKGKDETAPQTSTAVFVPNSLQSGRH